jgi:hypothetical protein
MEKLQALQLQDEICATDPHSWKNRATRLGQYSYDFTGKSVAKMQQKCRMAAAMPLCNQLIALGFRWWAHQGSNLGPDD